MARHFSPSTITEIANLFAPAGTVTFDPAAGLLLNGSTVTPEELAAVMDTARKAVYKPKEHHNSYFVGNDGPFSYRDAKEFILSSLDKEDRRRREDKDIRAMSFLGRLNALDEGAHVIREVTNGTVPAPLPVEAPVAVVEDPAPVPAPVEVAAKAPKRPMVKRAEKTDVSRAKPVKKAPKSKAKPKAKAKAKK